MNDNDNEEILRKKVGVFFKQQIPIHIKFKKKSHWMRGYILELSADYFVLNEFIQGEQPVFFVECETIEPYQQRREG